ncbi:MAG: DUF6516 family protein [Cyanobacteria bacterium P01_A01_bin.37]
MGKHSPTRRTTYFTTHARYLEQLTASGIVTGDNLTTQNIGYGCLQMLGRLRIRNRLILTVNKILKPIEQENVISVQSIRYAYNLSFEEGGNIFRYDNAHPHTHLGHTTAFHIHRYDLLTKKEIIGSPFEISDLENWPTLGEVIQEADNLYWQIIEKEL